MSILLPVVVGLSAVIAALVLQVSWNISANQKLLDNLKEQLAKEKRSDPNGL